MQHFLQDHTKTIANKLKMVIDKVISEEQSGFAPGRSIVKGIIISHEAIQTTRKLRMPSMVIKLDILKAYKLVNRQFILDVLIRFGFDNKLVN